MMRNKIRSIGILLAVIFSATSLPAQEPEAGQEEKKPETALELAKLGDDYLEGTVRGNVIQIFSEKSEEGLVPKIWSVDYYDLNSPKRPVRLKFINGVAEEQSRPLRIGSRLAGQTRPLPKQKLAVDSDKALEIAKSQENLKGIELSASKMELIWDSSQQPVWRVTFYAKKNADPSQVIDIDFVIIASETGEVLHNYLKVEKVRQSIAP